MKSYFTWENYGIFHFAGAPDSGFLRDIKLYTQELLENKTIFWFDFPNRFSSYSFEKTKHLDSLHVFQPDSLDTSVAIIDNLEYRYFISSPKIIPYLIIADFPFWYSLQTGVKKPVLTKLAFIISWLSSYSIKYKLKVLLVNELRIDIESGSVKPYLDFLIHRYTTENYYKE